MLFFRKFACSVLAATAAFSSLAPNSAATTATAGSAPPAKSSSPTVSPLLRSLSLHDRIAQLIVVRGYGDYPPADNVEYRRFVRWIHEDHVGGFIVAGRIRDGNVISAQPFEMAAFINHMQRLARIPLLVGSDFERGAASRVAETARFPYLMAFGAAHDFAAMKELGAATAQEARALGVAWIFAPDADVNNNPDNPVINTRSYSEDPQQVAGGIAAFIEGAHSVKRNYALVTAKHFPGHGDTAQDSHTQLAILDEPKERIESMELVPFRAAIEHGVDAVMTAHMTVPALDASGAPATLSRTLLTGLLRDELGFKGIVVTDAMEMQGITSVCPQGEAAVRAIEAGADVLLMPTDPEICIRAITEAVRRGRISRQRIDQSASKILLAKQRTGLFRTRFVNLDAITDDLDKQKFDYLAQNVAERALTLVKDEKHLFPIPQADGSCLVILEERQFSVRGETIMNEFHARMPGTAAYVVNSEMPQALLSSIAGELASCKRIYAAAFVTVGANRGNAMLAGALNSFLNALVHGPAPVALIALGSPYLVRDFPDVSSYLAAFSTSSTSESAVAKAILGDIPISGRIPVSIPGFAKIGAGLDVPAKPNTASNRAK